MRKTLGIGSVLALLLVVWPGTAAAQATPAITLAASAVKVIVGTEVTFSGQVSPAAEGETVELRDAAETVVATAATDAAGTFGITLTPDANLTLHAVWQTAVSEVVTVRVRVVVSARMTPVRLFDSVAVRGTVRPTLPGGRVAVTLLRAGHPIDTAKATIGAAGGYEVSFRVMEPGTYRARATYSDARHLPDSTVTDAEGTPLPSLHQGDRGTFVRLLEQRLVELHYRLAGAKDGGYDLRTADAVVAFRKVQGMERVFTVSAPVWRALADPREARPHAGGDFHLEVDQTHQVLLAVDRGDVTAILHISTGKPSTPTRDGSFRVSRKIAGFSPNHLYYPSYFDGNRALHGWTEVPTYPASHGCVRIPYWNAKWVFRHAPLGTRVIVYH